MKQQAGLPCHPATALLLWLFFVVWLNRAGLAGSLVAGSLLVGLLWQAGWADFMAYVRRTRLLLIMIWLVRLLENGLPGQWQSWRMLPWLAASEACLNWVEMLAALAVVMSRMTRIHLLSGVRVLLRPLGWFGLPVDRIAVRLWLTLEYADQLLHIRHNFSQRLQTMMEDELLGSGSFTEVRLVSQPLRWRDALCVMAGLLVLLLARFGLGR